MAEQRNGENNVESEDEDEYKKQSQKNNHHNADLELFCCLLQHATADGDAEYISIRRLLLHREAEAGVLRRRDWRCNGKGYVAFRSYIFRPRKWESSNVPSLQSTPGNSGRWIPPQSPLSRWSEVDSCSSGRDLQSASVSNHRTSFGSNASDIERKRVETAYSFVGMHCIFDQCKASDGTLTVCSVSEEPSVMKQLNGHSKDVTDFDFSLSNQYIASSSLNKTVRVWDIVKGICMRVIYGVSSQLCIRFHPKNNNFLSVGNADREINVLNFSRGRVINKTVFDNKVTSMDHDHTGQLIFCGDLQGYVYSVTMNSHTGALSRSHRHQSGSRQKSPVTTVQYQSFSLLAGGPVLLTCTRDGSLSFFSVALEIKGYVTLRCSLKWAPRIHNIQASFCPLLPLEKGEFIVAGSEDSNVYFYDVTRPKHTCVNKLQVHLAAI